MMDNKEAKAPERVKANSAEATPALAQPQAPSSRARALSPAAERALAEAQARRANYDEFEAAMPKERGGRGGHDPVRYGDWEKKGLATDF